MPEQPARRRRLAGGRADPRGIRRPERHVADLTRHLARRAGIVTLITRTPSEPMTPEEAAAAIVDDGPLAVRSASSHVTFPVRGPARHDGSRSQHRLSAVRMARRTARPAPGQSGQAAIVHGLGASVLGYALAGRSSRAKAPLVLNPQGLEEFGGTGQRFAGSPLKAIGYAPASLGGSSVREQGGVRDCHRPVDRAVRAALPERRGRSHGDDSQRD